MRIKRSVLAAAIALALLPSSIHGQEAFVSHLMEDLEGYIKIQRQCNKPFLVIFDERSPGIKDMDSYIHRTRAELRTLLVREGLPFFPSVAEAAQSVNELITYYRRRKESTA